MKIIHLNMAQQGPGKESTYNNSIKHRAEDKQESEKRESHNKNEYFIEKEFY